MLAVVGLCGVSAYSSYKIYRLRVEKQRIAEEVWRIPVSTDDPRGNDGLQVLRATLPIPTPWYKVMMETYEHELVAQPVLMPTTPVAWYAKSLPMLLLGSELQPQQPALSCVVPQLRKTLSYVGECLHTSAFTDAGLDPTTDVGYAPSVYDSIDTLSKTGEDIARMLPLRRPNFGLKHRALYEVSAYTGDAALPLYFLGKPNGDRFTFSRFSRNVQCLRQSELAVRQYPLDNAEFGLWICTVCCGAAAALVAFRA